MLAIGLSAFMAGFFSSTGVAAAADNCDYDNAPLLDSLGYEWDPNVQGVFVDGGYNPTGVGTDTFDQYADLVVGAQHYANADTTGCTLELGGRQVAYPTMTFANGLEVSRKVYVPSSGTAFARYLSVLHNPTSSPITTDVAIECDDGYDSSPCPVDSTGSDNSSPLGSDSSTTVVSSSSGDTSVDANDSWAVSDDGPGGDNAILHEWDAGSGASDRADSVFLATGKSSFQAKWQNVTVAPGETAIYMFVVAQRTDANDAVTFGPQLAAAPSEVFEGMSLDEVGHTRNWCQPSTCDRDGDGVPDQSDNCVTVANAGQGDLDGDGQGDACDSDIDGDGLSNSTENEIGTNPRNPDTDGDGFNDNADSCPKKPGAAPDGCPAPVVTTSAPADSTPPEVAVQSRSTFSLSQLMAGVPVSLVCDESCEAKVRLLGTQPPGSVRAARSEGFNVVLGRKYVGFGGGLRKTTVKPCMRTPSGQQSPACLARLRKTALARGTFRVKIYVIAQDHAGNLRETARIVTVKVPRSRG